MGFGYKSNLLKKFTFRSLIPNFSHVIKDSMQARSLTKILAEKSLYSPWLIYNLIRHDRSSLFFRVSDQSLVLSRISCDITLKPVLSTMLNLW